jgi:glycosyltransferase involved in cell wall biosynthesis
MNIAFVYSDQGDLNSAYWRCVIPAVGLNRYTSHTASTFKLTEIDDFDGYDAVIIHRDLYGQTLNWLSRWRKQGKVVIADFDDAFDLITPSNALPYRFWIEGNGEKGRIIPPPLKQFAEGLNMCNAAFVPSKLLRRDWGKYTDIYHIPNFLWPEPYDRALAQPRQHSPKEVWIGWGGSAGHREGLLGSGVLTALERICARHTHVRVVFCGNNADILEYTNIPAEQRRAVEWQEYARWPTQLREFNIGLAPLSGEFDRRRSWLKVLEYAYMGIPCVATASEPYEDFVGSVALVSNEPEAWEAELHHWVTHLHQPGLHRLTDEAKKMAEAATIEKGVALYVDALEAIKGGVM